jgi:5-methylthioadenosine/S-adenosylhomocysteine deaminase
MALVVRGTVATMDPERPLLPQGAVYLDDHGAIEAVTAAGEPPPSGFDGAGQVLTRGVMYPGLIDLHITRFGPTAR